MFVRISAVERSKARIYTAELIVTAEEEIPGLDNPGIKLADLAHTLCGLVLCCCRCGAVLKKSWKKRCLHAIYWEKNSGYWTEHMVYDC